MKTATEPSGLRLMRLINTRILEIAKSELSNRNRLRLYGTGGWWTAFDRSAFALSRLFPDAESLVITPPGAPFSVVGLTISDRDLRTLTKKLTPANQTPDCLEFPVPTLNDQNFDQWHTSVVSKYNPIVSIVSC